MATRKQKKAVTKMVENGGNVSKAMKEAGYSKATAKNPKKLTDSQGFKKIADELDKLGLTKSLLTRALVSDIKAKPKNRAKELDLGFRVKGMITNKTDFTSDQKPIPIMGIIHVQPDDSVQKDSEPKKKN